MFALISLCCLASLAAALPQFPGQFAPSAGFAPSTGFAPSSYQSAPALSRSEQHDEAGQYTSSYSTYDGQQVSETGSLKQTPDGTDYVIVKQGSYSYTSPEGTPVQVTYTADENGFHPDSPNLPVAPPPPSPQRF